MKPDQVADKAGALKPRTNDPAVVVTLPGEPQGKGRPRSRIACAKGGSKCRACGGWTKPYIHVYTPEETRNYEEAIALTARAVMRSRPPLEGPLEVVVTAVMAVPSSWSRKKRDAALAGIVRPTGTPDYDNLAKSACDALNGIVFKNDSQIVDGRSRKLYGEQPEIRIEVRPLEVFADLLEEA